MLGIGVLIQRLRFFTLLTPGWLVGLGTIQTVSFFLVVDMVWALGVRWDISIITGLQVGLVGYMLRSFFRLD